MSGKSIAKGAAVLTIAGLTVKLLGAVYRIPLTWILGSQGMGIYGIPSQFYAMTFILATAGLPTAISKMVAERLAREDTEGAMRVFFISRRLLLAAGICGALALSLGAHALITLGIVQEPESYLGMLAIAPVLLIAPAASAYRGLFAGFQAMTPVAFSQIGDQIFNVAGTLGFAYLLLPQGLAWAAAGGNLGSLPGALAGLTVLLLAYSGMRKRGGFAVKGNREAVTPEKTYSIVKGLVSIGVPISLASISLSIVGVLDNYIIIGGLVARGVARSAATAKYGQMTQMAMPFVTASTAVAVALAANLVPAVSRAFGLGQNPRIGRLVSNALRLALFLAAPIALLLFFWPAEVTGLLYRTPEAGTALRAVCPAIIFWSVYLIVTSSLQGLGAPVLPLIALMTGLTAKVWLGMYFIRLGWGVAGAGYATDIGYGVAASIVVFELLHIRGIPVRPWLPVLGVLLSLAPMAIGIEMGLALCGLMGIGGVFTPVCAAVPGLLFYGASLVAFKSVEREEIRRVWRACGRVFRRRPSR